MYSKRILFIASADLDYKSGGAYANLAFYKSLVHHFGNRVDLIPFTNTKPNNIDADFYARPKSNIEKILEFPRGIIHRFNPWILSFLGKRGLDYCCCVINDGLKGDIIRDIKKFIPKIIVIHHNCEVDFQNDNNRSTTLFGFFSYWVKRNERNSYLLADLNLFLTEYDKNHFQKLYGTISKDKCAVVGIYMPEIETILTENGIIYNNFAICGGLNNVQTIKGIKDFQKYLPILESKCGENLKLVIAGRNPGDSIKKFTKSRKFIKLIESPSNMTDVLLKSGVFICPINVGSGLKLRIMDGLKLGMPVLAHEVSSRGYEAFFNEPWFKVYNDKKSFENGLNQIVDYCKNNKDIRKIIIEKFLSVFSFESGDKRFIGMIKSYID